ncbi:MAG: 16S rRNA methyltransferase [Promethearchaeota archaeon]
MLVLGLIQTALELIPAHLVNHPIVLDNAHSRGKAPQDLLLDERLHAKAFATVPDAKKRGRPDIVHRSLLVALDSVLAKEGQLELFIHTYGGDIIQVKAGTRLPRRISRFIGLMEQLLVNKRVPLRGEPLLQIVPGTLETFLSELNPSRIILLSEKGEPTTPSQLAQVLIKESRPVVLVGGFAHGDPTEDLLHMVDQQVSFDPETLATSTIIGMLIHSMEHVLDLSRQRFHKVK